MAILVDKGLLGKLRGSVGKQFVIKQCNGKTIVAAYPSTKAKKGRKVTGLKKTMEDEFAQAVKYAQAIIRDPEKKALYVNKVAPGQKVYHYAIAEYKREFGYKAKRA